MWNKRESWLIGSYELPLKREKKEISVHARSPPFDSSREMTSGAIPRRNLPIWTYAKDQWQHWDEYATPVRKGTCLPRPFLTDKRLPQKPAYWALTWKWEDKISPKDKKMNICETQSQECKPKSTTSTLSSMKAKIEEPNARTHEHTHARTHARTHTHGVVPVFSPTTKHVLYQTSFKRI